MPFASQLRFATLDVARHAPGGGVADHDRLGRGDGAAGRHPARSGQRQRVVDRPSLHDPVQVERDRLDAQEDTAPKGQGGHGSDHRRHDRPHIRREEREVTVVAGGDQGTTDAGGDDPVGGVGRIDGEGEHRRELLRDDGQPERGGIDAVELGGRQKAAEASIAIVEEGANLVGRHPEGKRDLAAHGAEAVHDPPDWICGLALPDGPIAEEPESSPKNVPALLWSNAEAVALAPARARVAWPGWDTRAAAAKAASAAAAVTPIM
jgi:hypothetical protein